MTTSSTRYEHSNAKWWRWYWNYIYDITNNNNPWDCNYTLFVWVIYGQKTRNNLSPNVKYLKWILFPKNYRFDFDVQFKETMIWSYGYQLSNYSFIKECCQTILCFLLSVCICWYRLKTKNLIVCKQSTILSKMSTTIVLEFV